jgi:hypothetical protein
MSGDLASRLSAGRMSDAVCWWERAAGVNIRPASASQSRSAWQAHDMSRWGVTTVVVVFAFLAGGIAGAISNDSWPAVEALATIGAAAGSLAALVYVARSLRWQQEALSVQSRALALELERAEQARSRELRKARLDASRVRVDNQRTEGETADTLTITNESEQIFEDLVIDFRFRRRVGPEHSDEQVPFLVADSLRPGQSTTVKIPEPQAMWSLRFIDFTGRRWMITPFLDVATLLSDADNWYFPRQLYGDNYVENYMEKHAGDESTS